jgi:hypothetical protein
MTTLDYYKTRNVVIDLNQISNLWYSHDKSIMIKEWEKPCRTWLTAEDMNTEFYVELDQDLNTEYLRWLNWPVQYFKGDNWLLIDKNTLTHLANIFSLWYLSRELDVFNQIQLQ